MNPPGGVLFSNKSGVASTRRDRERANMSQEKFNDALAKMMQELAKKQEESNAMFAKVMALVSPQVSPQVPPRHKRKSPARCKSPDVDLATPAKRRSSRRKKSPAAPSPDGNIVSPESPRVKKTLSFQRKKTRTKKSPLLRNVRTSLRNKLYSFDQDLLDDKYHVNTRFQRDSFEDDVRELILEVCYCHVFLHRCFSTPPLQLICHTLCAGYW